VSQADYARWVIGKNKEMAALADDPNKVWQLADLAAEAKRSTTPNCAACPAHGQGSGTIKALDGDAMVQDADKTKQIMGCC
jgi:cytochrome c oxidase subunit 2